MTNWKSPNHSRLRKKRGYCNIVIYVIYSHVLWDNTNHNYFKIIVQISSLNSRWSSLFSSKKICSPIILFWQISETIEICNFFSTCFMFHSLGAMVTLPRYPDPVYFWRGSLSDLCTLHLARGHFFRTFVLLCTLLLCVSLYLYIWRK